MKNKILNILSVIAIAALASCVREPLLPSYSTGEVGESVKVELSFKIPPATIPQQSQARSAVTAGAGFSVDFFNDGASSIATRSKEATELYNLWLFQFHADGSIHGSPQKVSDQLNMVNDMALLNATLHVGTDQTLYIVVLGKKVTPTTALEDVRTLSDIENLQLDYIDNQNGFYYSRITSESEVPYAGAAKGISVRKVGDSDKGEIVHGTPDGFFGGIEVKRLISRVTLKHQFEVSGNTLEGMKLLKVPSKLFINPDAVDPDAINSISMVDLESNNSFEDADKDADGFFTSEWYVAQNKQGNKNIMTERDRYRKTDGTGLAPELGTNIEAWSYSQTTRSLYTVHQIYVGKNNTSNFDIETNNYYNLRTIINSGDTKDGRIRSYTAEQKIYLSATNSNYSGSGATAIGERNVYFDAHYGWRPVIIYAQGRKVTVGIYKDAKCTQLVNMSNPTENWLQLSPYPNYTEVVRNGGAKVLTNQFETNIFVPTRFKLYLYADEYITNEDGSLTEYDLAKDKYYFGAQTNKPTDFLKDRTLYVKVTTEEITAQGTPKKLNAQYTIAQKQGYYTGLFGGDIIDGQYTDGLIVDGVNEYTARIDDQNPVSSIYVPGIYIYNGYNNVFTNYVWSSTNNAEQNYLKFVNGKQATYNLATNPNNYVVNASLETKIPAMRKINNHIDLYQYTYFNSFHARFCHDLNRDKNGNGVIDYDPNHPDKNEFEWYLPSAYQALGILASAGTIYYGHGPLALASEVDATTCTGWEGDQAGWSSSNPYKTSWKNVRCVRNIAVPTDKKSGTKITTYTDKGGTYAMIDLTNLPYGIADRTTPEGKDEIYEELDLYSYSTKGIEYDPSNPVADTSQPLYEKAVRMIKNIPQVGPGSPAKPINKNIQASAFSSRKFIISPDDVYNDGDIQHNSQSDILKNADGDSQPNNLTMTWAEANGRLNTANSQFWDIPSKATKTGCYAYRGKSGNDEFGSWRVPNHRELSMILIFAHYLETLKDGAIGFQKLFMDNNACTYTRGYWSSTQDETKGTTYNAAAGAIDKMYGLTITDNRVMSRNSYYRLRCIRDIP